MKRTQKTGQQEQSTQAAPCTLDNQRPGSKVGDFAEEIREYFAAHGNVRFKRTQEEKKK